MCPKASRADQNRSRIDLMSFASRRSSGWKNAVISSMRVRWNWRRRAFGCWKSRRTAIGSGATIFEPDSVWITACPHTGRISHRFPLREERGNIGRLSAETLPIVATYVMALGGPHKVDLENAEAVLVAGVHCGKRIGVNCSVNHAAGVSEIVEPVPLRQDEESRTECSDHDPSHALFRRLFGNAFW